jgi:prepilin-type N-terminal cleavage/methylation domain-containing protein
VIRRLLADQRGYSLPELITVLSIMTVVLGSLTAVFVAGANAELDLNRRFQAQNNARIGLDKLRHEVRCASAAAPTGPSNSVTLTLPTYCKTGSGAITWCVRTESGSRSALYRVPGVACLGGVRWADYLTLAPGANAFCFTPTSTAQRATLKVVFGVNLEPVRKPQATYRLNDSIAFRNTSLAGIPLTPAPC